jgi:hypothetical protein
MMHLFEEARCGGASRTKGGTQGSTSPRCQRFLQHSRPGTDGNHSCGRARRRPPGRRLSFTGAGRRGARGLPSRRRPSRPVP